MPKWRIGLRLRLALGFAAILALSLGSVGLFAGYAAEREVTRVQSEQDRVRANRIIQALTEFYASNGGWVGAQTLVDRISFQTERDIIVLNNEGRVVANRAWQDDRRRGRGDRGNRFFDREDDRHQTVLPQLLAPIFVGGSQVGSVTVAAWGRNGSVPLLPLDSNVELSLEVEPPLSNFADAVQRALTIAGVMAGTVGILLVVLMSRRMLASIGSLTTAARDLGSGDLSSRTEVRGNDEVAELGRAFNSMADALEESERSRQAMVSDVAHELRTPLANIQGHVEALQDGLLEPDADTLDTLHRQIAHLNRLVDDLRLLAQSEARELRLELELVTVQEVVQRVTSSFGATADAGSVRLQAEYEETLPPLNIDRTRMEQVLGNLVDNAIRHSPSGGSVVVSASRQGDAVRVEVADNGPGIPPEELPRVFDRLYRVDPSRDRETGGAGLGLTIARQLVEAHGGTIWAESNENSGSRFGFDLPVDGP